jgi:hypothetical protein
MLSNMNQAVVNRTVTKWIQDIVRGQEKVVRDELKRTGLRPDDFIILDTPSREAVELWLRRQPEQYTFIAEMPAFINSYCCLVAKSEKIIGLAIEEVRNGTE